MSIINVYVKGGVTVPKNIDALVLALEKIKYVGNDLRYKAPEVIHGSALAQFMYEVANEALTEKEEETTK